MSFSSISQTLTKSGKSLLYTLLDTARTNFDDHQSRITALESRAGLLPSGTVIKRASSNVPPGFVLCDGSALSRNTYAVLFAAIGVVYGAGDGVTTFNVPDLRGRVPVGAGTGTYSGAVAHAVGDVIGEETHVLTVAELASHSHDVTDHGHTHTYPPDRTRNSGGGALGLRDVAAGSVFSDGASDLTTDSVKANLLFQNTGGGGAHNNVQPFGVCNYVIKV
jgi:microcystin-dependent protein